MVLSNSSGGSSRNRGFNSKANNSSLASAQWSNDIRERFSSTELLDITSLSEVEAYNGENSLNSNKINNLLANLPEGTIGQPYKCKQFVKRI